jgi:uracil-DNA glycosylase family 4
MSNFCPVLWSEEPTPVNQQDCRDCGLYKQGSRMIWGEGNPNAPIMIILDNPGGREDHEGNSMVCGTRQTLQQVASEAGLKKDELYVTFILKRKPVRAYDKEKVRQICMMHLRQQIQEKKPSLILCLGNVAVQSFFQDPDAEVKTLRGNWHTIQGCQTAVAYHPLAVRRRPNLHSLFLSDLQFVADRYNDLKLDPKNLFSKEI